MADRLKGKVAIVTGAGSRGPGLGNGKATAVLFAREGASVLCVDQMKERAEETVGLIRAEGGIAEPLAADVTQAADCEAMIADAVTRWGGLDVLHNNVGIESRHTLMETTEEEWDRVMAVDAKSMLLATKAAVIGFVRTCAVQLGPKAIRVNAIAPGMVWTPMVSDLGEDARERRRKASPLGTEGSGWDVGWGAVYLASDESRWVTGQTLIIDAGVTTR